jgi:hypothetical protein
MLQQLVCEHCWLVVLLKFLLLLLHLMPMGRAQALVLLQLLQDP